MVGIVALLLSLAGALAVLWLRLLIRRASELISTVLWAMACGCGLLALVYIFVVRRLACLCDALELNVFFKTAPLEVERLRSAPVPSFTSKRLCLHFTSKRLRLLLASTHAPPLAPPSTQCGPGAGRAVGGPVPLARLGVGGVLRARHGGPRSLCERQPPRRLPRPTGKLRDEASDETCLEQQHPAAAQPVWASRCSQPPRVSKLLRFDSVPNIIFCLDVAGAHAGSLGRRARGHGRHGGLGAPLDRGLPFARGRHGGRGGAPPWRPGRAPHDPQLLLGLPGAHKKRARFFLPSHGLDYHTNCWVWLS